MGILESGRVSKLSEGGVLPTGSWRPGPEIKAIKRLMVGKPVRGRFLGRGKDKKQRR